MISLLLWMSSWAGVMLADFFIKRKASIDVAELYRLPETSAYGDINWGGIIAFLCRARRRLVGARPRSVRCATGTDLYQSFGRCGSKLARRNCRVRLGADLVLAKEVTSPSSVAARSPGR